MFLLDLSMKWAVPEALVNIGDYATQFHRDYNKSLKGSP